MTRFSGRNGSHRPQAGAWLLVTALLATVVLTALPTFTAIAAPPTKAPAAAGQQTHSLPLTRLGLENTITLPGVRPQRVVEFTRPRTWTVRSATLYTTVQHSPQLIEGSRLQVILNDKILKTLPLTSGNVKATGLAIALPTNLLQDHNKLIFRVEQHYTDTCEDPVNPTLWTNVLANASRLSFAVTPMPASQTLQAFPFPLVDALNLEPTTLQFVIPRSTDPTIAQAMARLTSLLAQASPQQEIQANAHFGDEPLANSADPLIILATPGSLRGLSAQLAAKVAVSGAQPVIQLVTRDNGAPALLILGTTPAVVAKGVDELLNRSVTAALPAANRLVVSGNTELPPTGKVAPYVIDRPISLATLGYDVQTVKMLTAPPINFRVPVMTEFLQRPDSRVTLDLHYGFSPHLNPKFSGLEFRLNNYTIANVPLTNVNGNDNAKLTVTLPSELIQADNHLVAQFHLMQDKHGLCSEPYRDTAWGKIYPDSKISVNGKADTRLPSLALLKQGYPYTQQIQLAQTTLLLEHLDRPSLNLMLAVANRLGRQVNPSLARPLGSQLEVGLGTDKFPADRHVILIGGGNAQPFTRRFVTTGSTLTVTDTTGKDTDTTLIVDNDAATSWLEQTVTGNGHILTRLVGTSPQALDRLKTLFVRDALMARLPDSAAAMLSADGSQGGLAFHAMADQSPQTNTTRAHKRKSEPSGMPPWAWIVLGTLGLFVVGAAGYWWRLRQPNR